MTAFRIARISSSYSWKNVTSNRENVASSGTAVSSVVNASEPARSAPRSARKPRNVSDTTPRIVHAGRTSREGRTGERSVLQRISVLNPAKGI